MKVVDANTGGKPVQGYLKLNRDYAEIIGFAELYGFDAYYKVIEINTFAEADEYVFLAKFGAGSSREYKVKENNIEDFVSPEEFEKRQNDNTDVLNRVRDILIKNAQNPLQAKVEIEQLDDTADDVLMVALLGSFEKKKLFFEILDELQELKTTKKKVKKTTKKIKSLEIDKKEAPQPITTDKVEEIDLDEIDLDNLVL